MSTLRVSTIQDTAGSNSSTPAAIANGIAKAWVNFDAAGTIRASFNVSSVTKLGTGSYTINFTNAFSDTNYVPVFGSWNNGNSNGSWFCEGSGDQGAYLTGKTTTSLRLANYNSTGNVQDNAGNYVAIFR